MTATVLVIDDLESARSLYKRFLEPAGYAVIACESVRSALDEVRKGGVDIVLTDLRMPEIDGLAGLREIHSIAPGLPVLLVTAYATIETAVEAMRLGAVDYVKKPFEPEEVKIVIERALKRRDLEIENVRLRDRVAGHARAKVSAASPRMRELVAFVERIARTDVTVLIRGETGTGKDRLAALLHASSPRAAHPLISVNCCAIPENLLESELFGHERGAYSGATETRAGYLRDAAGGTLLLDEIGDMPLGIQPKLLQVLQSGEYYPVGGKLRRCEARIVCATNQDLEGLIAKGQFRADLYYRINAVTLSIPPLRERPEDIRLLAAEFLAAFSKKFGTRERSFAPDALAFLLGYPWPGNVRQLENVVERAVLVAESSSITQEDFPDELLGGDALATVDATHDYESARESFERAYLARLLDAAGGNVSAAARLSGVHRATLYKWLLRHGLQRAEVR